MSLTEIFKHAWIKAQQKEFCHKKLIKLVENAFDKSKLEELLKVFTEALFGCYDASCADKSPYCARGLEFLAKLAMKITLECVQPIGITNSNGTTSQVYDITLDPFFTNVLKSSLKFSDVDKTEVRFNTCYFIMTLLQNIGNNVEMDYSICNIILDSLVPLLYDVKANVRIQAIKALVRLQEPSNADCVVLKSFLILSTDPNSEVRKAIISHIAPHPQSYIKVRMRTTDTDLSVRQAAYMKFADVNPKMCLKIIDRNIILNNGLMDQNKKIKHLMSEILIPKWLNSFEGDYLLFFRALRLDADENDINNFEKLCTEILDIFLRKSSLTDIVKYLPVNKEDKLIPIQQLRLESVFYWSNLINYLRNVEDGEEYLVNILPELTAFSNYIERVIKEKSSVTMDEWENLEYQTILFQLFQIASGFDISDEVGRRTLYALIIQTLTTNKFHQKVIDKMLRVAAQLNSDIGSLTIDLCQIISEIREPLINEMPSEDKLRKRNFEVTQMKVKIHQLEINEEEALKKKDFQLAHIVQNELKECQRVLDNLKNLYIVSEKVRVSKDDPETLCRCLDILIGLLKIPNITIMCPALRSCRDEFLMPLLSNNSSEILWRFILCLGLFSLMDKDLAFKHINFLCLPLATYRVVPNCDKLALKTSIACVTDVIRVFGVKVIGMEENAQSELNQECNPTTSRRKLYSEDLSQPEVLNKDDITIEFIIDIIVDMLDDEDEGVRQTASTSIQRLIIHNFPVSPELICRLILKWYNPETEKQDTRLNIQLGTIIECFATRTKGARRVVQKAIIPIISSIVNASGTSPLLEIDIENVLKFLAALTNDETETIHDEIAMNLIERMLNKPNDACSPYLIKLLTYLELSFRNLEMCKNIIDSTEMLLGDIVDKIPKKYLLKFNERLMAGFRNATIVTQGDQSEIHVANGTEGNIGDQSSQNKSSLINGELTCANHEQFGDINGSENNSEDNQKGNSSNSESDSEEETHSNSNTEGSDITKGSGKRLLMKGKTTLRKITEEREEVDENEKSTNCDDTKTNEDEIESISNYEGSSVDDMNDRTDDRIVCLKYDYTPKKNAEKLRNMKTTLVNSHTSNNQTCGNDDIQTDSPRTELKKTKNLDTDVLSERSSRSTRLKPNSRNANVQIISKVVLQKTIEKKIEKGEHAEGSSQTKLNANSKNVQNISQVSLHKTSEKKLPVTRSHPNYANRNVQIISQVILRKTPRKQLEKQNKHVEESSRSTRSKVNSKNHENVNSQAFPQRTPKKQLEGDNKYSEESTRSIRSKVNSKSDKIQINSQVLLQKTPKKILGRDKSCKGSSGATRTNPKPKNENNQSISSIVLSENPKRNSNRESTKRTSIGQSNEKKIVESTKNNENNSKKQLDVTHSNQSFEVKTRSKQKAAVLQKENKASSNSGEDEQPDAIKPKKNDSLKKRAQQKATNYQYEKKNENSSNSSSKKDERNSTNNTYSVLKKSKSKMSNENQKTDSDSQNKNEVMNEISNGNRRSSRIEDRSLRESSADKSSSKTKKIIKNQFQQESTHSLYPTRKSRISLQKTPERNSTKNGLFEGTSESKQSEKDKLLQDSSRKTRSNPNSVSENVQISPPLRETTKKDLHGELSKETYKSAENCTSRSRRNLRKTFETNSNNKKNNSENQLDKIQYKKDDTEKSGAKTTDSQKGNRNESGSSSNSGKDEHNENSSDSVFKRPKRKISKEKPKNQTNNNRNSNPKTDGVLQSLNGVMNEISNNSINRRSSRIADRSLSESLSTGKRSRTKSIKRLQQESSHSPSLKRPRMSDRLNVSNCSSRKKLDFSSFSDETILKTFLQGDEEFQVLENTSIEDINSNNTSYDSKKENISIDVSTTSTNSSRRSSRRKRRNSSSPQSPPKKKMMRTKYKRNLQRVSQ